MTLADGDLSELANSLAELLGAPVTIEDRDTIVVAYSRGHQDVDEARIGTILGQQVPLAYREAIREAGVFEQLQVSDEVIVVELPALHMRPRAVVAARHEGELLGSIWAAVPEAPSAQQRDVLLQAAPVVAAHLAREHAVAETGRQHRTRLLTDLLAGGERAVEVAADRGLTGPLVVAAVRDARDEAPAHLLGSLTLHLAAVAPAAVCGVVDRSVHAVLRADGAQRILTDFVARLGRGGEVAIGLGDHASYASDLPTSRAVADQVAHALVRRGRLGTVADLRTSYAAVLVDRLDGFLTAHRAASPLTVLEEWDAEHGSGLVAAARAFLDHGGNVHDAATSLHVHPNTMRNRVRRMRECGVDLADPETRLALMVHLAARPL